MLIPHRLFGSTDYTCLRDWENWRWCVGWKVKSRRRCRRQGDNIRLPWCLFFVWKGKKKIEDATSDGCCEVTGRDTWVSEPEQEVKAKASRLECSSRCIKLSTFKVRDAACAHQGLVLSVVLSVSCMRRYTAPQLQRIVCCCPYLRWKVSWIVCCYLTCLNNNRAIRSNE